MKSNALTLRAILLGTIISLSMSIYGSVNTIAVSPALPAIPQDRAEDDNNNNDDDLGISSGGTISSHEILCGPGVPELIKNETEPTGEVEGFLVFQWERKLIGEGWTIIPGANGLDYEPSTISSTTTYRRGCREAMHQPWIYSNEVTKKIVPKIEEVQIAATPVTCKGGSDGSIIAAVAGGTPGYMFDWVVSDETGNELTDIPAGLYNVEVTDQNGCTYTSETVEVKEPEIGITINEVFLFDPTCAGAENGAIFIEALDGVAPYEYSWSNGAETSSIMDLSAGNYNITVTDALGCTITKSDIVLEQPEIIQLYNQAVSPSCFDSTDGSINLSATGGTAPYLYFWSDGITGNSRSDLSAGTYAINIIDYLGCLHSEDVVIEEPEIVEITPFTVNNKTCKASINIVPSGGTAPYSFEWDDGSTQAFKTGLCPGTYNVEVTDHNGCTTAETVEIVTEIDEEDISISVVVNPFHQNGNIIIKLPFEDHANINVYSPTGQLIEKFDHQISNGTQEIHISLDLAKYSNGVYILEVFCGGLSTSEKVMVIN